MLVCIAPAVGQAPPAEAHATDRTVQCHAAFEIDECSATAWTLERQNILPGSTNDTHTANGPQTHDTSSVV
eukprot:COSAG06_NODE_61173_length_268_cov_0.923077_1_plen_71_part_10